MTSAYTRDKFAQIASDVRRLNLPSGEADKLMTLVSNYGASEYMDGAYAAEHLGEPVPSAHV